MLMSACSRSLMVLLCRYATPYSVTTERIRPREVTNADLQYGSIFNQTGDVARDVPMHVSDGGLFHGRIPNAALLFLMDHKGSRSA
jgi:hypothetical protein